MVKIGIIGGSGLDDPKLLTDYEEKEIETPYGKPSSKITIGKISGVEVCIIARHGKNHDIPPSIVNYRANIYALKLLECTHIIATSAVGSLREEIKPGNLVFPSQVIDNTCQRKMTFCDSIGTVVHTPMAEPYDKKMREIFCDISKNLGFSFNKNKTLVVVEGPRFSTKAESHMFRQIGADIIGMTGSPEVFLANELSIPYQTIAMSTDYDCWKEGEDPVTWEMVQKRMKENSDKVKQLLLVAITKIANHDEEFIKNKIRKIPDFPKPGINFWDITTLLKDVEGMKKVVEILSNRYKDKGIGAVAGVESRGFIIGALLANKLEVGFVPIRKKGKLPFDVIREEYSLQYGKDSIEVHKDAIKPGQNVVVIDDLIATGGTAIAAANLIEKTGGNVYECAFIIEFTDLPGRNNLENQGRKVFSIVRSKESGE